MEQTPRLRPMVKFGIFITRQKFNFGAKLASSPPRAPQSVLTRTGGKRTLLSPKSTAYPTRLRAFFPHNASRRVVVPTVRAIITRPVTARGLLVDGIHPAVVIGALRVRTTSPGFLLTSADSHGRGLLQGAAVDARSLWTAVEAEPCVAV